MYGDPNGWSSKEGDHKRDVEKENEYLKQTVCRLSLELKTQKKVYEDEILYFKSLIDKHLKNLVQVEKTKQELHGKIKTLNGQLGQSNEELTEKTGEIEILNGVIEKQKACISHTESLLSQQTQLEQETKEKYEQEQLEKSQLASTVSNLETLTQRLSSKVDDQETRMRDSVNLIEKLQQILELQIAQQMNDMNKKPEQDETDHIRSMFEDENSPLNRWKYRVDQDLSKVTTKIENLTHENSELKTKMSTLGRRQGSLVDEVQKVRTAQTDFLNIWLS